MPNELVISDASPLIALADIEELDFGKTWKAWFLAFGIIKNATIESIGWIISMNNIVLEYGGGAIGPQCFPGYQKGSHN